MPNLAEMSREFLELTVFRNTYIPIVPTIPQAKMLVAQDDEVLYGGAAGGGKALHIDTDIPTPNGWEKMGDLVAGDAVFGEDGKLYRVDIAHPKNMIESYRLTFDDGSEVIASGEHLWLTYDAKALARLTRSDPEWMKRRRERRPGRATGMKSKKFTESISARNASLASAVTIERPTGTIRDTDTIRKSLATESGRCNHAVPLGFPLEMPDADLPIDPYVLGLWLGDGTSNSAGFTTADKDVLTFINDAGYSIRKAGGTNYGYIIGDLVRGERGGKGGMGTINTFAASLRLLSLIGNKHVPLEYMRASRGQRLELLRGLMDTDGCCNKNGSVEFCNTNKSIVSAVVELACSLGHKATMREGLAKLYGRIIGPKWMVKWTPTERVFKLKRKYSRQRVDVRRVCRFRYIKSCEPVGKAPVRCITVSNPTGMFLAGRSMIPTHNSIALLACALQYIQVPDYHALLLRRTFADLLQPKALIPLSLQWMFKSDARWNGQEHRWYFPNGNTLTFGYLDNEKDKYQYQGAAFNFIGLDELTHFSESMYSYLFSRLRKEADMRIPSRMRATANPGGEGHEWVKTRFQTTEKPGKTRTMIDPESGIESTRIFIPATLDDNPHIDKLDYRRKLSLLDPVTRAQLEHGDWNIRPEGNMFKREWFTRVPSIPEPLESIVRAWDLAATPATVKNPDPDWAVGCKMGKGKSGKCYIIDVRRKRGTPKEIDSMVTKTAEDDGVETVIHIEQEPGSAGKMVVDEFTRKLSRYAVYATRPTGDKVTRARPLSAACSRGEVILVDGNWNAPYLDVLCAFPDAPHDDDVDATAHAFESLQTIYPAITNWGEVTISKG